VKLTANLSAVITPLKVNDMTKTHRSREKRGYFNLTEILPCA